MITLDRARQLLLQAVETQGHDFVYCEAGQNCYYEAMPGNYSDNRGVTGCLIGVALGLAGETRHRSYNGNVMSLHTSFPDMMNLQAARYFLAAQVAQDNGTSWGRAYEVAEHKAALMLGENVTPAL